jgi:hypothetical protein
MDAFAGIDVAFAKRKYLPISVCVCRNGNLQPLHLRSLNTLAPPRGHGNAKILDNKTVRDFAESTSGYLREVEKAFSVKIRRIAIDAPSDPKADQVVRREAEKGLHRKGISLPRPILASSTPSVLKQRIICHAVVKIPVCLMQTSYGCLSGLNCSSDFAKSGNVLRCSRRRLPQRSNLRRSTRARRKDFFASCRQLRGSRGGRKQYATRASKTLDTEASTTSWMHTYLRGSQVLKLTNEKV